MEYRDTLDFDSGSPEPVHYRPAPTVIPPSPPVQPAPQAPFPSAPQAPVFQTAPQVAPSAPFPGQPASFPGQPYPVQSLPQGLAENRLLIIALAAVAIWWYWPYLRELHVPIPDLSEPTVGRTIARQLPRALAKACRAAGQAALDGKSHGEVDAELKRVNKDYQNAIFKQNAIARIKGIVPDDFQEDDKGGREQRRKYADYMNELADELER